MEARAWDRRKRKSPVEAAPVSRREVKRQLALASGGFEGGNRDPVSNVTENFHQTFDSIGQRRARALAEHGEEGMEQTGLPDSQKTGGQPDAHKQTVPADRVAGRREGTGEPSAGTGQRDVMPGSGIPIEKFSQTAFRKGSLSASVLGGTGKVMLISCLQRTVEQNDPKFRTEDTLLHNGSKTQNVPGHAPDQMLFNRGYVNSAVGLVVDTLRDARQTVDSMRDMAMGTGDLRGGVEGAGLFRMYPFLDNSREQAMVERYEERLRTVTDVQERAVLQNGLVHARAMLDRKASMKEEFINQLRKISDQAQQALEEFEAPGFAEEVFQALRMDTTPGDGEAPEGGDIPPDEEGGDVPPEDTDGPEGGDAPPEDGGKPEGGDVPPEDGEKPEGGDIPPEGGDVPPGKADSESM